MEDMHSQHKSIDKDETVSSAEDFVVDVEYRMQERLKNAK